MGLELSEFWATWFGLGLGLCRLGLTLGLCG